MIRLLCRYGILVVAITSADPENILSEINQAGISITKIKKLSNLSYQFCVCAEDYSGISTILNKRNGQIRIQEYKGLYWKFNTLSRRPILIFTVLWILILSVYLPGKILFIESEGNQILSDQELLNAAETCGISLGAARSHVRSEKTKNHLLSILPQLQWAGINTAGCRAVISVRERVGSGFSTENYNFSNITAHRDAFVLSTTASAGTLMVHPGDTVIQGQTLISGYEDHGFHIQATRATGEIFGLTNRSLTAVMPAKTLQIIESVDTKQRISLLIRKKRINLWKGSRISDTGCGRMYEEYYVSLPGGYRLPFAVCIDRYVDYDTQVNVTAEADAYSELQSFSDIYLLNQMNTGQILKTYHHRPDSPDVFVLENQYICSEIIGREQREQIGDHHE